jgi:hypothetical protein
MSRVVISFKELDKEVRYRIYLKNGIPQNPDIDEYVQTFMNELVLEYVRDDKGKREIGKVYV